MKGFVGGDPVDSDTVAAISCLYCREHLYLEASGGPLIKPPPHVNILITYSLYTIANIPHIATSSFVCTKTKRPTSNNQLY